MKAIQTIMGMVVALGPFQWFYAPVANPHSIFTFVSLQRMVKKAFSRKLMLAGGILAAIVILCSQAFQKETCSFLAKIKTDKTEKSAEGEKKVIAATPADAVTSGQAVEMGDANPSFIREIILDDETGVQHPIADRTISSGFLKTLFRVIISPQAP